MTAKELLIKYVVSPFEREIIADKGSYNSIFERYQSDKMREYEDKAKIEGIDIYIPKVINDLKYEVAEKAPTLYHIWATYANLSYDFLKESNAILRWIDERLEEKNNDSIGRKCKEEQYQHELFYFYNNLALIRKLQIRLIQANSRENKSTSSQTTIQPDKHNKIKFEKIYGILKERNFIGGSCHTFLNMCFGYTTKPKIVLEWKIKTSRSKTISKISLCDLLLCLGKNVDEIKNIVPMYFGFNISRDLAYQLKNDKHSEYYLTIKGVVDEVLNP